MVLCAHVCIVHVCICAMRHVACAACDNAVCILYGYGCCACGCMLCVAVRLRVCTVLYTRSSTAVRAVYGCMRGYSSGSTAALTLSHLRLTREFKENAKRVCRVQTGERYRADTPLFNLCVCARPGQCNQPSLPRQRSQLFSGLCRTVVCRPLAVFSNGGSVAGGDGVTASGATVRLL